MRKTASIITAAALAACLIASPVTASADELTTAGVPAVTSLPYVEDVNPTGARTYSAVVVCYGGPAPFKLRAVDMKTRKAAKVRRIAIGQWSVDMKAGREYKISVRGARGRWQSIGYRIY